jgi:hypothetical protein
MCVSVCVCVFPLLSPLTLSQSFSSWQPPPPDWTGLDSLGVPSALPLPLPAPLQPIGLSFSGFRRGGGRGGGGEKQPVLRSGEDRVAGRLPSCLMLGSGLGEGQAFVLNTFLFFAVLGMEPRASHMLDKRSTTEFHPQPCFKQTCFGSA